MAIAWVKEERKAIERGPRDGVAGCSLRAVKCALVEWATPADGATRNLRPQSVRGRRFPHREASRRRWRIPRPALQGAAALHRTVLPAWRIHAGPHSRDEPAGGGERAQGP